MTLLAVAVGGAAGAVLRYLLARVLTPAAVRRGSAFPWATFAANTAGSLLLGVLTGAASTADGVPHALLATGLCGALTTYSTFSLELLTLCRAGRGALAAAYAGATLAAGLGGAALGWFLTG